METLETIKLDKMQELARYRRRTDAKPYVVNKLREQIAALENCVDLNDSKVDNQLLILLRDTLYKALYVEDRADVLIVGCASPIAPRLNGWTGRRFIVQNSMIRKRISMNCWRSAAVFEAIRPSPGLPSGIFSKDWITSKCS